jgi:hypothetical protein
MLPDHTNRAVFAGHTRTADVAIVEGVMGLFDGAKNSGEGSTAAMEAPDTTRSSVTRWNRQAVLRPSGTSPKRLPSIFRSGTWVSTQHTKTCWRSRRSTICRAIAIVASHWSGLVSIAHTLAVTVAIGFVCRRRIGGVTGDTLGANAVLCETVVLVAAVAQS